MNVFLLILIIAFLLNHFAKGEYNKENFTNGNENKDYKLIVFPYTDTIKIEIIVSNESDFTYEGKFNELKDVLAALKDKYKLLFDIVKYENKTFAKIEIITNKDDPIRSIIYEHVERIYGKEMYGILSYQEQYLIQEKKKK